MAPSGSPCRISVRDPAVRDDPAEGIPYRTTLRVPYLEIVD